MIRIGYAGSNTELPSSSRTFRLAGYSEQKMLEISHSNISSLENILHWNEEHGIHLFRITSNLIPFGSHPVNSGAWKKAFGRDFERIGGFIRANGMQVSLHPGQYTILNTPDREYLASVLRDLDYHASMLDLMGLDAKHKIVVHGGGAYKNKKLSLRLLQSRITGLPHEIRQRLAMENDELVFHAEDILALCRETGLPGILDVFHHEVLPSFSGADIRTILLLFGQTWAGGRQKIHYSEQDPEKRRGSHSQSIDVSRFGKFLDIVRDLELDIMLEVKDKQSSVLKLKKAFPELQ